VGHRVSILISSPIISMDDLIYKCYALAGILLGKNIYSSVNPVIYRLLHDMLLIGMIILGIIIVLN